MNDEHPERRAELCEIPAAAGPAPEGPVVGLDDSGGNSKEIAQPRSSSIIVTHVNLLDIDNLREIFGKLGSDGDTFVFPVWLMNWQARLEAEDAERRKAWPFSHEIIPRQLPREELIKRQYAHLPPKVKW